jgi:AbrB family looped-hinge helix DNA binding protein
MRTPLWVGQGITLQAEGLPHRLPRRLTIFRQSIRLKSFAVLLNYRYTATMTATVTINQRGNLTLPAAIRKEMGLSANDQMVVETMAEGILLPPA